MSKVQIIVIRDDGKEFHINTNDSDWRIPSDGLDGFGNYSNSVSTVANVVGDGDIVSNARLGSKDRTIKFIADDKRDSEALRNAVTAFFTPKYAFKVYLSYMGRTRWFEGIIHKFDAPSGNIHKKVTARVTFLSPNPYLKSYDDFGEDIASVSGRIAFPYLCSVDNNYPKIIKGITGGVFNFAQEITLNNDGDVDTYCRCIMRAKGEVEDPVLFINGNYVKILDTLQSGDVIEMDFAAQPPTVKKNGVNFIGHCDRTSAFDEMILTRGDSRVSFSARNGTNLLQVSIYYNKLYATM